MVEEISEADHVLDRLTEEIDWREQELSGVTSLLIETASDVDDWLSEKHYERIEEAIAGLSPRLDTATASLLDELALLNRIRNSTIDARKPSRPTVSVPTLRRSDLANLPVDTDDDDVVGAYERRREARTADHLLSLLRFAQTPWELACSAARAGDSGTAAGEHDLASAALKELNNAYMLWFECLGQLCEVSPESAGLAGETTSTFTSYLHQEAGKQ